VGKVTKPGLEVPPGEPAINSGPRKMITAGVKEVLDRNGERNSVNVEIFVPDGERIAEKTLNAKLGILGGISILGTTGVVKPMSHEAYTATISSALSVARASGCKEAVFSTGRRSERCAQKLFPETAPEAFVQIGDFFSDALCSATRLGFQKVTMAVFFGKAVKMAQESPCTHAHKTRLSLQALSDWCLNDGCSKDLAERLANANTAREAFDILLEQRPSTIGTVGEKLVGAAEKFSENRLLVDAVIFDFDEKIAWRGGAGKAAI
jgi:cobalt-precorrin-5B (C1)-methyltransferase